MTLKANLVLVLGLAALVASASGQSETKNPTLPSVPRADGAGPSISSMSPAVGDASTATSGATVVPRDSKTTAPAPADLDAAAKAAERDAAKPLPEQPEHLPLAVSPRTPVPAARRSVEPNLTKSVTGPVNPVATGLNSTDLAKQIRSLPYESRDAFLNDLETRVENSERDFDEVEHSSFALKGDARATFRRAMKDVKTTRKTLWTTLKDARVAPAQAWPSVRNQLATAYEGYAITLTRAEASSSIGH